MKSSAVLINVARGEVVDQQALVEVSPATIADRCAVTVADLTADRCCGQACASSQIAGAVLDVYVRSRDHPPHRPRFSGVASSLELAVFVCRTASSPARRRRSCGSWTTC